MELLSASVCPRVRNVRTLGSRDSSRSLRGFPEARMVLVSGSSRIERVPTAKMLARSWVMTTTVVFRLSLSSTIRSSRRRALMGSSPAEGSSKNRISGSSAMARARAALFCIPR